MLVDWFTVVAQLVNFLLLVWLLERVLYRPILGAIARRQERIDRAYREADRRREMAREEADRYRRQRREFQDRKQKLLCDAHLEAEEQRDKLLEKARENVDRLDRQWRTAVRRREALFFDRLQEQTRSHLLQIARRTLSDIADAELEDRAVVRFQHRLQHLDESTRSQLQDALATSNAPVLIATRFELSPQQCDRLLETVKTHLVPQREVYRETDEMNVEAEFAAEDVEEEAEPPPLPIRLVRDDAPLCGIELYAAGYEIAWSFDGELRELEARIREVLRVEIDRVEAETPPEERLRQQLTRQTYDLARQALQDIADVDLERRTVEVFLRRLQSLNGDAPSLVTPDRDKVAVCSSFELSDDDRQRIVQQLRQTHVVNGHEITFERSPDLICGIEVRSQGREIAWSLDDYLRQVQLQAEAELSSGDG